MRRLVVLTAAVAVAVPALVASTVNASAVGGKPTLDPAAVAGSMSYLEQAYGVSPAEALRRLELQLDATRLDTTLRAKASASYGGMALDQQHGGVLTVDATDPAAVKPFLAQLPDRSHVRTRTVAHSLAELTSTRDQLAQQVAAGADSEYLPAVDQQDNNVVLWRRTPGAAAPRAMAQGGVVVKDLPIPKPLSGPVDWGYCHPLFCSDYGPMRGGLRLDYTRDDGSMGGCTTSFNVRSTGGGFPNNTAWVLTAGHCAQNKSNFTPTQHNGTPVVNQHGVEKYAYPYDYQFVQYVDQATADKWLNSQTPHNEVLLYCRPGGLDSTQACDGADSVSANQSITGIHPLADIKPGWVVCADGSASNRRNYPQAVDSGAGVDYLPGTRCGQVTSTDVGINTNICARPGDSGGPLFSQVDNTALGILEGNLPGQNFSGPCTSGEANNYSPIGTILDDVNAFSGGKGAHFEVITTPNG
ncbi:trypsin-like serine protease [Kutzneria kofuensis]|uniref:Streptogrisin C n=1 Tax=Kutzneria kofuensis TaxID=103725 RepID=A0A7W9KRV1_9PSEU|nr:trypsin-like serine protease [Kutzneria kofuensis]MBB5897572.1 streptogrisin C [Kutzneria kofuensis]